MLVALAAMFLQQTFAWVGKVLPAVVALVLRGGGMAAAAEGSLLGFAASAIHPGRRSGGVAPDQNQRT